MQAFNIPSVPSCLVTLTPLAFLAYNIIRYLLRSVKGSLGLFLLVFGVCFNPYTFQLIFKDSLDTLEQMAFAAFIIIDALTPQSNLHYVWLGVSSALNPSNFLYFFLNIIIRPNRAVKSSVYMLGMTIALAYLQYLHKLSIAHYVSLYFPQSFEPQFNLIWMLYAHMFNRYLLLYQIIFVILQVSSAPLIASLRLSHNFKIVLLTYFKVYCCYRCSQLCLVVALGLSVIFMKEQLDAVIAKWWAMGKDIEVMKVKTMTLIVTIANIAFFPLDRILLSKYLNDFSLNIGYLFLFFGFPWILNSVYLAQMALNINSQDQKEQAEVVIRQERTEKESKT